MLGVLAACLAAPLCLAPGPLRVGTTWSGTETLHFVNAGQEIDETHRFSLSFTVTGLQDGTWAVERRSRLLETRIMGETIPPLKDDGPARAKLWLSPAGLLLNEEPFDGGGFRLDRLIHFWMPANRPDQWSATLATTNEHFVSKGTANLTLARVQRTKGSRTYDFSFDETETTVGIHARGVMEFEIGSGRLLRAEVAARNALLPGGADLATVTLTYVDAKAPPRQQE